MAWGAAGNVGRDAGAPRFFQVVNTWGKRHNVNTFFFQKLWAPNQNLCPLDSSGHTAARNRQEVFHGRRRYVAFERDVQNRLGKWVLGRSFCGGCKSE